MKSPALCLLSLALAACASQAPPPSSPAADNAAAASSKGAAQVASAVTAPLNDFNLVRAEIPAALRQALKAPYAAPQPLDCATLSTEVRALDATLGPDLDTPASQAHASLIERGTDAAGNAAVGALRNAAEGLVPFRSWVRKLSGAERYSKEVAAALAAGTVHRAFLKGLGQSLGCAAPAAPAPAVSPGPTTPPSPASPQA
jgi:hypothetical protein